MKVIDKIFFFVFFILNLMVIPVSGQQKKEKFENRLKTATGLERLQIMDSILTFTIYNDLDTSFYYANEILKGALKSGDLKYESLAYSWLTVYHFFKGNYYKAQDYINKAIKLQEQINDTIDLGNSYINLVMIYAETGRLKNAINSAFKALELFEAAEFGHGIIVATGNIGIMYSKLDDYKKAVEYLKKTWKYMIKYNEFSNLGELYNNMGLAFYHLNSNDSAIVYFNKAIKEFIIHNERKGIARAYLNLGNTYGYNLSSYNLAIEYYDSAFNVTKDVIEGLRTKIFENRGKIYEAMGEYEKGIEELEKALILAEKSREFYEQEEIYYHLCQAYKRKGYFDKAIGFCEKYNSVKDSIAFKEAKITIANLEAKFENERNKMKIAELETKSEFDKKIKIFLGTGIILLLIIIALVIRNFHHKRKRSILERELLSKEKESLKKELNYKTKQLTSQALMMMQKNKLLNEILKSLSSIKNIPESSKSDLKKLKQRLRMSIRSEEDWELFQHYFEDVNKTFFPNLLKINSDLKPSELKLSALIKLKFTIKEAASLLNISPDSVKTTRHILRKKLGLQKSDNLYDFFEKL